MKKLSHEKYLRMMFSQRILFILLLGFVSLASAQAQITINGIVTDSENEPMVGISVVVKNTTKGTVTDLDGKYKLEVPDAKAVLVYSFISYKPQEILVGSQRVINVRLESASEALDEVVVVGYGTQKKINLTGSVAVISSETLANRPVNNIGQALQGVVPNLNVSMSNGALNTVPSFNVRGGTSMAYNSSDSKWEISNGSPLILVDGIEMGATYLNMMNPNDIDGITVLKDASASAIYGARAAYGVMLVTTKSGKFNQKTRVDYSFDMQWNNPTHLPDVLDSYTQEYASQQATLMTMGTISPWKTTLLEAKQKYMDNPIGENAWIYNEGSTTAFTWVANVNPYKLMVRDWTPIQKHSLSISGGGEKVRYYLSLGYQDQEGMYRINTDEMRKYNGLMSVDAAVNKWFSLGAKISYSSYTFEEPYMNSQKGSVWSAMKNDAGRNLNQTVQSSPTDPIPNAWTDNIVGWMAYGANSKVRRSNLVFNLLPTFTITKDLKLKGEFAYKPSNFTQKRVIPTREYLDGNWSTLIKTHTDPSSIYRRSENTDLYTINVYGDFNKRIAEKHNLGAVVGFNQEWYTYTTLDGTAEGILTEDIPVMGLTTGKQYTSDSEGHWAVRGAFFRLNYNFNERYLFEFNGRYDGTSRFPTSDRYKMFPSFSLGWRISEEAFMKNTKEWLDNLKIRGSWGSLGNQNVDNYAYYAMFGSADYVSYIMDDSRPIGIKPPGLVSPSLTWETAQTVNAAIEITTLRNRLDFSYDIYQRKTVDILMDGDKYPALLGTSSPRLNSGELKTNGWELTVKWRDKLSSGIKYDVGLVLSDYQTTVEKFAGNPNKLLSSLYDGMKMGQIWGYETVGILQNEDFTIDDKGKYILNGPSQSKISGTWYPGDIRYKDIGGKVDENGKSIDVDGEVSPGDNTVANPGDRKIIGNSTPRLRYGITGNIEYKGFDLNLFFQGVAKRDVWISDNAFWGGTSDLGNWYMYNNSWTPTNTGAKYPMYAGRGQNQNVQTGYLFSGAYFRLKQVNLGYTLPHKLVSKAGFDKLRVNISGYNLFSISDIPKVLDPDLISSAYPVMRSISVGIQIGFLK